MRLGELPIWFRFGAAFELLIAVLIGGFGTFAVSAFLPYGPNRDREGEILIEYAATYLFLPVLIVLASIAAGIWLMRRNLPVLAAIAGFWPLLLSHWLFFESLR